MQEIFQNLNISFPVVLVNFLGFVLLLFTANAMVFKPIGKVIQERQGDIQKTYDQLDADKLQMQSLKSDYEARLDAVEAEGRERINNMIKEAQATRDSVLSEANGRAHELIARAEAEVVREKEQAMITIRQQVADLAIGAAERVIGDNLDQARSRKLVDEFITSGGGPAPDYAKRVASSSVPVTATATTTATAVAPTLVAVPTPVVESKPTSAGAGLLAGAVAAGMAAVAAVASAVMHAGDEARDKASDIAHAVSDKAADVVDDARVQASEFAGAVAEKADDVADAIATTRKPRAPRKKADAGEVGA